MWLVRSPSVIDCDLFYWGVFFLVYIHLEHVLFPFLPPFSPGENTFGLWLHSARQIEIKKCISLQAPEPISLFTVDSSRKIAGCFKWLMCTLHHPTSCSNTFFSVLWHVSPGAHQLFRWGSPVSSSPKCAAEGEQWKSYHQRKGRAYGRDLCSCPFTHAALRYHCSSVMSNMHSSTLVCSLVLSMRQTRKM